MNSWLLGTGKKGHADVSFVPCTTHGHGAPLASSALLAAGPVPEEPWFLRNPCSWGWLLHQVPADAGREKRAPRSRSHLEVVTFQGVWGEWDEEARQDIPAPPSPRPSGCVLMPPHSRLSQSSGFSLSAGGNPNSTLYGCSSAKLRILIEYYQNAFSLHCLVLLSALVSVLIWSRIIKKFFDYLLFTWDSSGRSHSMSP